MITLLLDFLRNRKKMRICCTGNHAKGLLSTSWIYLIGSGFILSWWLLAFKSFTLVSEETSSSFLFEIPPFLQELSPLYREELQDALAGNFSLMFKLIDQWDQDAQVLIKKNIIGIQRLAKDNYLQASLLKHILQHSSAEDIHTLNCKINLEWLEDDSQQLIQIKDHFCRFLPQTYAAASFLLAIASPQEILALPKGLRYLPQLYHSDLLARIPTNIDHLQSEKIYLAHPDLAFVAPYSHPPMLEMLHQQEIQLYRVNPTNTLTAIQNTLLKIGHASHHGLEAKLLAIFMEACFLSMDNRLKFLHTSTFPSQISKKLLCLYHHEHYMLPTIKCLTGQLIHRILQHYPKLVCFISPNENLWFIPCDQEKLTQINPDCLIIVTSHSQLNEQQTLRKLKAFKKQQIFYIDEAIQESPTQYIALAYFDLFQAIAISHSL